MDHLEQIQKPSRGIRKLIAGTRGSRLARIQTAAIAERLRERCLGVEIEERVISTSGDRLTDVPADQAGVVGFFTSEIERELVAGRIDFAVHSCKDLPTDLAEGCVIGATPQREAPEDALVAAPGTTLDTLSAGARVGTGSVRRAAQLRRCRPDVEPVPIRGNVDTRLAKLDRGEFDAIILAVAGLRRLGCEDRIAELLGGGTWYYAVGQGALAVEVRRDDAEALNVIQAIDDPVVHRVIEAERALLRRLGGGCGLPVGVRSNVEGDTLRLAGMVAEVAGEPFITVETAGTLDDPEAVGIELAERLLAAGANEILGAAE